MLNINKNNKIRRRNDQIEVAKLRFRHSSHFFIDYKDSKIEDFWK